MLAKTKLNIPQVLVSKALIDLYINHDKFSSVKNVLTEYNKIKEKIKNAENAENAAEYTNLTLLIQAEKGIKSVVETIADNDGILWLNEKDIEEG